MNKPFDPTKPCKTRDGREVKIYAVYKDQTRPIHGAIKYINGWELYDWYKHGESRTGEILPNDLINIPEKIVRWMNIYSLPVGSRVYDGLFKTKEEANYSRCDVRIACIRIEFEEGEGLNL